MVPRNASRLSLGVAALYAALSACGDDPGDAAWRYGPAVDYPVDASGPHAIPDPITGGTFHLPSGGRGTLTVAPILSGPLTLLAGATSFAVTWTGAEPLELHLPRTPDALTSFHLAGEPTYSTYEPLPEVGAWLPIAPTPTDDAWIVPLPAGATPTERLRLGLQTASAPVHCASLTQALTSPSVLQLQIYDAQLHNTLESLIPALSLTAADVFDMIAQYKPLTVDALREAADLYLGVGQPNDALPALLERTGWSYHARGRLVDAQGQGLAGASVQAVCKSLSQCREYLAPLTPATTDAQGYFELDRLFPGRSTLRVTVGPSTKELNVHAEPTAPTTARIELDPIVWSSIPSFGRLVIQIEAIRDWNRIVGGDITPSSTIVDDLRWLDQVEVRSLTVSESALEADLHWSFVELGTGALIDRGLNRRWGAGSRAPRTRSPPPGGSSGPTRSPCCRRRPSAPPTGASRRRPP